MAAFYAQYPASASGSNASVGTNGAPAPGSSTLVAGENPSGELQPLQTDASGNLLVAPASSGAPHHVIVDSSALPTGAATAANQATEIASLASIDSKLTNPLPVSGPLTDTQLRATPVPVSGTVAVSNPGLTDTELRASPVPVSLTSTTITGSVAVTGPLTDTELRATPVPVSGTVSTGGLTDAELRASPVPVSGTVTANAGTGTFAVSAAALPLPSGAATEATLASLNGKVTAVNTGAVTISTALPAGNNNIGDVDVASLPVTFNAGNSDATTQRVVIATNQAAVPVSSTTAGKASVALSYNIYSSSPVTTAAYVQLVASTSAAISHLSIFDSSGQGMIIATGAAASEVDKIYVAPGGGEYQLAIPSGTRISIKALTANASSGYNLVTGFGV